MDSQTPIGTIIQQLEERLLQPDTRHSAQTLADMLANEFIEYGRSGRIYDKQQIIEGLQQEVPARITLSKFKTTSLAPDIVLANYLSTHRTPDGLITYALRSSIWKQIAGRWQVIFHQGTQTEKNL